MTIVVLIVVIINIDNNSYTDGSDNNSCNTNGNNDDIIYCDNTCGNADIPYMVYKHYHTTGVILARKLKTISIC